MRPVRCGPVSLAAAAANSEFNRQRRKLPLFLDSWIRRLFPSYTSTGIRMTLVVHCQQTLAASSEKTLSQGNWAWQLGSHSVMILSARADVARSDGRA